MMIRGREHNKSIVKKQASSDLLVCFPTRAHLALMPKPTCSPNRPNSESTKRHLKRLNVNTRAASSSFSAGGNPSSPLIWAKDNQIRGGGPEMSEPTSPKVTCAGQIKVRPRSGTRDCRNWQSVMEEIEKIHNSAKHKKKSNMVETFGFKKDVMSFLTCLRNVRFDFRCFGSFHQHDLSSDDEGEDEDEDVYEEEDSFKEIVDDIIDKGSNGINDDNNSNNNNNAVFSKWYMVLQENEGDTNTNNSNVTAKVVEQETENDDFFPVAPPKNALLLMRCRSAPAKSWLEDNEKENDRENVNEAENDEENEKEEAVNNKKRETLAIVMKYDTDFYKLSNDIAQETWVVGEIKDPFARSRSWRR